MENRQFELWPCHPKPLPDELLTCWLVRVAHAHQLKVQTFCDQVFGKERQIWNRDCDRLAPRWLVNRLSIQTGTPLSEAFGTTLSAYRTVLYRTRRKSSILPWILPLHLWHRKLMGHGLQYCPECLSEDEQPYFRKRWRVALYTFCPRHLIMVHDRCPKCGSGVAFYRLEQGQYGALVEKSLAICHQCGFDLREAPRNPVSGIEKPSFETWLGALKRLSGGTDSRFDLGFFSVLHHLCKVLQTRNRHMKLREFVIRNSGAHDMPLADGRNILEELSLIERHYLVGMGMWLMADPKVRIFEAWASKKIRYNVLKKDFDSMPRWYRETLNKCTAPTRTTGLRCYL